MERRLGAGPDIYDAMQALSSTATGSTKAGEAVDPLMPWKLALAAAVEAVAALAYVAVAWRLARRKVDAPGRLAHNAFVAWWWAIAVYGATIAVLSLVVAGGHVKGDVGLLVHAGQVVALTVGATGLATYVMFIYTGHRMLLWPFAAYYAGVAAWALVMDVRHGPVGFVAGEWWITIAYETTPAAWKLLALTTLYLLPLIVATGLYFGLLRKVEEPHKRRRILLVGGSLLAWGGSTLAAQYAQHDFAMFATAVGGGLVSAIAVLMAYPPR